MSIIPQLILNSLIAGAVYTLMTLGFNLAYSTTKFFNLAHGVMAAVGGYTVFYLSRTYDLPVLLCVIIGVLFSGVAGFVLDKIVYRPLRKRNAGNMILLVASLGAFTVIQAAIAILFSSQFQTLAQVVGPQSSYTLYGGVITHIQLVILLCGIATMFGLMALLKFTMFGKAIQALGDDAEVAKIVGINTERITGYVFFISSAIAGLAGILIGFDTGIEPTMGMPLLLKGVIAAIVGGVGNIYAGVVGAFLLGFVENFGIWKISGEWKDAIAFVLLLFFLLFRPNGLFKR